MARISSPLKCTDNELSNVITGRASFGAAGYTLT